LDPFIPSRVNMTHKVVIVDYGMGNIWSVCSALSRLDVQPTITDDPAIVASADFLILPGVGSFFRAMNTLNTSGLADALKEAVLHKQRNILGICLGMQLLANQGTEDGLCDGLSFIPVSVDRFSRCDLGTLKVPHIGFNLVHPSSQTLLFRGFSSPAYFYFVHSYRLLPSGLPGNKSLCHYGVDFLAAYEHDNIFATQFHPEKSQSNGVKLLSNFLNA